jgi:hypothetical protein
VAEEIAAHLGGITSVGDKITNEWGPKIMDIVGKLGLANTGIGGMIQSAINFAGQIGNWIDRLGSVIDAIGSVIGWLGKLHMGGVVGPGRGGGGSIGPGAAGGCPDVWENGFNAADPCHWWNQGPGPPIQGPRGGGLPGGATGHGGGGLGFHEGGLVPTKFHSGGRILPNERLALLQVGEVVLPNSVLGSFSKAVGALAQLMKRRNGPGFETSFSAPRMHDGGLWSSSRMAREPLSGTGGAAFSTRSVHFNAPIVIHAPAGSDGASIGRDFLRTINEELGGALQEDATRNGNSRL